MGPKSPADSQPVPRRSPRTNPAASWSPSTPGPVLSHPSTVPSVCKTAASPKTPRSLIQPSTKLAPRMLPICQASESVQQGAKISALSASGASGDTHGPQHAKLRPLAGRPVPTGSSKSPTGKGSSAQAAKPILKLSMQSSSERPKQPRHTSSMPSVQYPVHKDLTSVSSKGVNDLSSSDTNHPLNQNKTASAPSPTVSGHQDSTSAVCALEHGLLAPGQTPDSQGVPVVSTHSAKVSLDTPLQEALCEAQVKEEYTNAITIVSVTHPQAVPEATSASAAAAEGAAAQQVPDSLQNPGAKISSDACSEAQQAQRSSGAPASAETGARLQPALQHEDYQPTTVSTPQHIDYGAPPATASSPRAAVSPHACRLTARTDTPGHALPTNPICSSKPQVAASTTNRLDQPLTAPAHEPAANCPTDDEQAKQAGLATGDAVCMELSESAAASTALCKALALSLPAPIKAVPAAAAAAAAASATGLAGVVPHTSAWSPATELADPLAQPIEREAVCMPFSLMGPSMLPAMSPGAAASVSSHSRAETPHHGVVVQTVLPQQGTSEDHCSKSPSPGRTLLPNFSSFSLPSDFSLGSISPPNPPGHCDSSPQPPSHASSQQHTPPTSHPHTSAQLQHSAQQQLIKASSPDSCPSQDPMLAPPPGPMHRSHCPPPHHLHLQGDPKLGLEHTYDPHTSPSLAPQPVQQQDYAQQVDQAQKLQRSRVDKQAAILSELAIRAIKAEPGPALSPGPRDSCRPAARQGPRIKTTIRTATFDKAPMPTVKVVASGRVLASATSPKAKSSCPTAKSIGFQSNPAGYSPSPEASGSGTTLTLAPSSPSRSALDSTVARGQQPATAELDCSQRLGPHSLPDPSLISQPSPDTHTDGNVPLLQCTASVESPQESAREAMPVSASEVLSQAAAAEHLSGACNAEVLAVAAGESAEAQHAAAVAAAAAADGSGGTQPIDEWEALQAAFALAELAESARTGNSMSEIDDTQQLHKVTPHEEAVTLTELRDHLRSLVTQLDDAPSEPTMLPWLPHREHSPHGEGCSPASHTPQTPGLAPAAFADDVPAAAYNPQTDSSSRHISLPQESQPCMRQRQAPSLPQTLGPPQAPLAVPSSDWPILTPTSRQTDSNRLQTELTKLQAHVHPAGSATWTLASQWSDADTRAAATAPRHIIFEGSVPVSTPFTSVLPLSARAEGVFSCSAVRNTDAVSAEQRQSGSTSKRKRASDRRGTGHSQRAQQAQQAEGSIDAHLPAEEPDRAVKRSKRGLRAVSEQRPEMSDKDTLVPVTRELRAMTSVKAPRHTRRPASQGGCTKHGEAVEAGSRRAEQQATIVMETAIQQLQFELMALRQYHSSREASLERQLQAAQSHAAQIEAAQVRRTQEQFVDDCLKVEDGRQLKS